MDFGKLCVLVSVNFMLGLCNNIKGSNSGPEKQKQIFDGNYYFQISFNIKIFKAYLYLFILIYYDHLLLLNNIKKGINNQTDGHSESGKLNITPRRSRRKRHRVLRAIRQFWRPNKRFPEDVQQIFSIQPIQRKDYNEMFPKCQLRDILVGSEILGNPLFGTQFYIRKVVVRQNDGLLRRPTVHFIAGPYRRRLNDVPIQPPAANQHINNDNEFLAWKNNNPWYGTATCSFGQIDFVSVNNEIQINAKVRSARRCGFGSLLSYLCFLDKDHLLNRRGYQLSSDVNWDDPQMQQIQNIGFNNRQCSRIIYVNYAFHEPGTLFGNKAIIYGAAAAGYTHFVTFRNTGACANCCEGGRNGRRANTFLLHDLVDDFNRYDPREPLGKIRGKLDFPSFRRHYGRHWYFCSTVSRRRYRTNPSPRRNKT